jgi:hypothetical protein
MKRSAPHQSHKPFPNKKVRVNAAQDYEIPVDDYNYDLQDHEYQEEDANVYAATDLQDEQDQGFVYEAGQDGESR